MLWLGVAVVVVIVLVCVSWVFAAKRKAVREAGKKAEREARAKAREQAQQEAEAARRSRMEAEAAKQEGRRAAAELPIAVAEQMRTQLGRWPTEEELRVATEALLVELQSLETRISSDAPSGTRHSPSGGPS